jgi:hypothetical protein
VFFLFFVHLEVFTVADLFTQLTEFMTGLLNMLNMLLLPTDPATGAVDWTLIPQQPVKILIWFGLAFPFVSGLFGLIRRMATGGAKKA